MVDGSGVEGPRRERAARRSPRAASSTAASATRARPTTRRRRFATRRARREGLHRRAVPRHVERRRGREHDACSSASKKLNGDVIVVVGRDYPTLRGLLAQPARRRPRRRTTRAATTLDARRRATTTTTSTSRPTRATSRSRRTGSARWSAARSRRGRRVHANCAPAVGRVVHPHDAFPLVVARVRAPVARRASSSAACSSARCGVARGHVGEREGRGDPHGRRSTRAC